ncbi:MAG: isochorismatase family protein [Pseudomonadota bacterium]
MVDACAALLSAFRTRALPVVFTTVVYDSDDQAGVFRARLPALNALRRGSRACAVDSRLAPLAGEHLVEKHYASAFFGTDLAGLLREAGADSLIVTGLTTSGCVRATVVDALQHDFVTWVPREAVGDRNADAHMANLHDMHAKYAEVVSIDDVLVGLEHAA